MQINKIGTWGEIYAARYLRDNKYEIVTGNYRSRLGEIDIIAEKDGYICFVEVKARTDDSFYQPREAVDLAKQERIIATAKIFMKKYLTKKQPRFDICEIIFDENYCVKSLNYYPNSF